MPFLVYLHFSKNTFEYLVFYFNDQKRLFCVFKSYSREISFLKFASLQEILVSVFAGLWPLLQKFYSGRGPGHLALSGHFTYSFYLSKIPNLRSFGNSWGNSRTRSLIHCFTGDESKLFWNVAKLQDIIFKIFW